MSKREVRKVSRTNTRNQKKEKTVNKKWLIAIISTIVVVLAAIGIGLGIYFSNKTKEEEVYVSTMVYFNEPTKTSNNNEVTFKKDNYQALKRYIKQGNNKEHIFVFIYDGSAFYGDVDDKDHYQKEYTQLVTRLADLQYAVDEAKKLDISVELYVVDVNVDDRCNTGIFSDSEFGAVQSSDSASYSPALVYLNDGEYKKEIEYQGNKYNMVESDWKNIINSTIPYSINYIKSLE